MSFHLQETVFYTHTLCPVRWPKRAGLALLSAPLCTCSCPAASLPLAHVLLQYAERVWIVLLERGVPHRLVHIDLSHKPSWYRSVNPRGLVPALQHSGRVQLESADICRHMDALAAGPSLTPADFSLQREMEALLRGPCSVAVSAGLDLMSGGDFLGCWAA